MDDQAQAVASDPLERMMQFVENDEIGGTEEVEESATESEENDDSNDETESETEDKAEKQEETEVIIHNGEEKVLTKSEIKELAQQGFDYTQKTQQLAEHRRYLEQQEQALQYQARFQAQFTDQIAEVKAIEGQLAQWKQINWNELAQSDPMQYLTLHHQYTEAKEAHQEKINQLTHLQTQAQQVQAQQQAQRLYQEAQAMKQAIPEWKDEAKATAEMGELKQWLSKAGFAEQEVASIMDHRQVAIARKAMLYDKMMASGQKKVASAPPTAKPGAKQPSVNAANDAKVRLALKKTGKGDYAAKLIEKML